MTDALSIRSLRTREVLPAARFQAARARFSVARELSEGVGDVLRNVAPDSDRAAVVQVFISRCFDRTERAIAEFRHASDELRDNARGAPPAPRTQAQATGAAAVAHTPGSANVLMTTIVGGDGC
jgi:hypothetical protein